MHEDMISIPDASIGDECSNPVTPIDGIAGRPRISYNMGE